MRALIVIDMQYDFCPGGNLAVEKGDELVPMINSLMPNYQGVICTQDWHPDNHMSFAANQGKEEYSIIEMPYGPQVLWPKHCVGGTKGAEIHHDLDMGPVNLIIRKGFRPEIDSYSAFFENDHKTATGLEGYLRERGFKYLDFVGLATDFCVAWSAIDAAKLGFEARVLMPLTRAIDLDGSLAQAIADMQKAGVVVEGVI